MNDSNIVSPNYISCYFNNLINAFFKILPMTEENEPTRVEYMLSLRREMLGMHNLIESLGNHTGFLSLLNILSFLIENPLCETVIVKQDVFKAIAICKDMAHEFSTEGSYERMG